MKKEKITIEEAAIKMITEDIKSYLPSWLNDELNLRVREEVRKEIQRIFREMGRQ